MYSPALLTAIFSIFFSVPIILCVPLSFSCSAKNPKCLSSFVKNPAILNIFGGVDESQNDVARANPVCAAMTVIFARGTDEPGNVGLLTGPPFFAAIEAYMNGTKQLAIQGVNYPANLADFLAGGSASGASTMATLANQALTQCPHTSLLLSGYSQGAQLVHLATSTLPSNVTSRISSIVLFGDPRNGTAIAGVHPARVLTVCHVADTICQGGFSVGIAHFNYSADAAAAATFAMGSVAHLGITSKKMATTEKMRFLGS